MRSGVKWNALERVTIGGDSPVHESKIDLAVS
jgi:hypothetical protein